MHLNKINIILLLTIIIITCNRNIEKLYNKHKDIQTIIDGFETRRMQALEEIINTDVPREICDEFLSNQIKALAILYVADKTNNYERVDRANKLLMEFCRLMDEPGNWLRKTNHGSIMLVIRTLVLYEDKPELLYPETVAKLREGKEPNGTIIPEESLKSYFDETCWDPNRHLGIHRWPTAWEGAWEYTENHRLQMTTNALLMCQVFENETYNPPDGEIMPFRNQTPKIDDYWGYWKHSFYEYLTGYKKLQYPIEPWQFGEFRHMDWGITEKDGGTYAHVFLGDFWLLRDLIDDPVMAKYAEMMLDLILADYAEEAVQGIYVGAHENSEKHSQRLPGLIHIYNYHIFGNLPYKPKAYEYFDWGSWGYLSMLTSDYTPSHPDFPKVVIDMAVNKPLEGYMVKESVAEYEDGSPGKPKATWVKPDYSLGFGIDSWVGWGYHAGGAYVATKGNSLRETGLAILPFGMDNNNHFDLKYSEICPMYSVVGKGVAITQNGTKKLPSKIWIKDGFQEDFEYKKPWMFFSATSSLGRDIYIAVRPVISVYAEDTPRTPSTIVRLKGKNVPHWAYSTVPKDVSGKIIKMDLPYDYLIWEMSDNDQHSSFEDFKKDIVDNKLAFDSNSVAYISCQGEKLTFDRNTNSKHLVNGHIVDENDFRYIIRNPWGIWKQNQKEALFKSKKHSAYYNFDPNGNKLFIDEMPLKEIN